MKGEKSERQKSFRVSHTYAVLRFESYRTKNCKYSLEYYPFIRQCTDKFYKINFE